MPSRRRRPWPPTRYGYLPPEDAVVTSWTCGDWDECGKGGPEHPGQRWPRRCPGCKKPIFTHHLEEPWAHAAKRVELDALLSAGPASNGWARARCEDQVWHVEEALLNADTAAADAHRRELDALVLAAEADEPFFHGGSSRLSTIFAALEHQAWDLAIGEIRAWRSTACLEDIEIHQTRGTNARQLVQALLLLLEDQRAAQFTHRAEAWQILCELKPAMGNGTSISQDEAFARLQRVMSSVGNAREEAVIAALQQLHELDLQQKLPGESFPLSTPTRMSALGRHEMARQESGIGSLVWSVCLSPYMDYERRNPGRLSRELADIVPGGSSWTTLGAARCLQEFTQEGQEDAAFWSVLDAALDIMVARGFTDHLTNREKSRLLTRQNPNEQTGQYPAPKYAL
ncbi:MAG TPA: hypothetical protein VGS97_24665 [Actinocrinis sp.]|uniref:hypothetical protein n=1 Tax=Actinocrinis sp. TaxID=1920516 RepID=UPI002DDD841A|nr:hypothetical protein [Actinocrinis sp.]HEV2347310.1 hypothetical protein [Actinocrinis sp.]